jgi:DNA-binding winged helix-turn-helix (wHTH) protein
MNVGNISSVPDFQPAHHTVASAGTKEFPPFGLDPANQCLWRDGQRVLLKPKPFAILHYLVDHAGRLVTQEELLRALWPDTYVQPEVLKRHIFEIRDVLGDDPKRPTYIETLSRRGYQFIAPVRKTVPAEPAAGDVSATTLVGRDRALGELQSKLQKAIGGQRQIVFVTGEPGIGKTTLVDEFQRQAWAHSVIRMARGQCVEGYGGREAHFAVLEALGKLCRGPEGDSVIRILAAQAPSWLVQFPALVRSDQRTMLQREIQGATRQRMLREIADALATIASESPLLLVLEDLHWADHSTVDLISALARGRSATKLMVIGTFRPVDVAFSDHPLKTVKQDLLIHRLVSELPLEPLGEKEIALYLAGVSPDAAVSKDLVALLHWHSDGNPLYMVGALENMAQRGFAARENGIWRLKVPVEEIALEVPENLRAMIEMQIERLTAEEQLALEAASINGVSSSASVRAIPATLDEEKFEGLCEEMSRRRHVLKWAGSRQFPDGTVSPWYQLVHALYREVLYRRQSPVRRAKLHLLVGEQLEALCGLRPGEAAPKLAHHFEAGGDRLRASPYRQLAVDTAVRRCETRQVVEIPEYS